MKKRFYILCSLLILVGSSLFAQEAPQQRQGGQRFSPEKFEADLQQFITSEAKLSLQEATCFFPVYKEMLRKMREVYNKQRALDRVKPADEQGCKKSIQEHDNLDLELKRLQQAYHNRFMELLPASKVYDILKAESLFHRRMLKRGQSGQAGRGNSSLGEGPRAQGSDRRQRR